MALWKCQRKFLSAAQVCCVSWSLLVRLIWALSTAGEVWAMGSRAQSGGWGSGWFCHLSCALSESGERLERRGGDCGSVAVVIVSHSGWVSAGLSPSRKFRRRAILISRPAPLAMICLLKWQVLGFNAFSLGDRCTLLIYSSAEIRGWINQNMSD